MNRIVILSLIALVATGIGLVQQNRLTGLKGEFSVLTHERRGSDSSSRDEKGGRTRPLAGDAGSSAQASPQVPVEDLARRMAELWLRASASEARVKRGLQETSVEKAERKNLLDAIYKALATFTPADVMALIRHLETNPDLPQELRDEGPARACFGILNEVNPKVLLEVIPRFKDYPNPQEAMSSAFHGWLRENPVAAVKWFDEETKKGNPLVRSAGLSSSVIIEEMKSDPAHALGRVLSQAAVVGAEFRVLGANIAMQLGEPDENIAFFAALRRESEKSPDSRVLSEIRETYVGQFGRVLPQWPAEMAIPFLNSGFTPAEKTVVARELAVHGDLDEPERWASWMYGVDPIPGRGHPLEDFMSGWLRMDPEGVRVWLEQAPPGDFKDRLVRRYSGNPE